MAERKIIGARWIRRTFAQSGDPQEKPSLHKQLGALGCLVGLSLLYLGKPTEAGIAFGAMAILLGLKGYRDYSHAKLNGNGAKPAIAPPAKKTPAKKPAPPTKKKGGSP